MEELGGGGGGGGGGGDRTLVGNTTYHSIMIGLVETYL